MSNLSVLWVILDEVLEDSVYYEADLARACQELGLKPTMVAASREASSYLESRGLKSMLLVKIAGAIPPYFAVAKLIRSLRPDAVMAPLKGLTVQEVLMSRVPALFSFGRQNSPRMNTYLRRLQKRASFGLVDYGPAEENLGEDFAGFDVLRCDRFAASATRRELMPQKPSVGAYFSHNEIHLLTVFGQASKLVRLGGLEARFVAYVPHEKILQANAVAQRAGIAKTLEIQGLEPGSSPAGCDIWVNPQDGPDIPYYLLHAMAHGVPVVSVSGKGARRAVIHEETGLLLNSFDSRQIAAAVSRLCVDTEMARKLGLSAWLRTKLRFDLGAKAQSFCEFVYNLCRT